MICTTKREGFDCIFMKPSGCVVGGCKEIVDECSGCNHVCEGYCEAYHSPDAKWRLGKCNFATHIKPEQTPKQKAMNALKRSKRKAAGRI